MPTILPCNQPITFVNQQTLLYEQFFTFYILLKMLAAIMLFENLFSIWQPKKILFKPVPQPYSITHVSFCV